MRIKDYSFLPGLFNMILALSSGMLIAISINSFLEVKFFSLPETEIKAKKQQQTVKKDYRYIYSLFSSGFLESNNKKTVTSDIEVGDIYLLGIIGIHQKKYALLRVSGRDRLIPEGAFFEDYKLKKVGRFFVILSKDHKSYRLYLNVKGNLKRKSERPADEAEKIIFHVDRRFVKEKTSDIGSIMKDIFVVPVLQNGETIGFRFKYVKPGSLLYRYGIRSGDMIISVNGKPIRNVEEAFKIYNLLRNESRVEVVIDRNGKREKIIYEIR